MIGKIESYSKQAVKDYINKISKFSPYDYYKDLMSSSALFSSVEGDRVSPALAAFITEYSWEIFESGFIELRTWAPIIYIKFPHLRDG
jgi:DNA helicase-2/ATP-dependent DNA helicase PcrA